SLLLVVQERPAERPLGSLGAGHHELLRRELLAPLRVALDHRRALDRAGQAPTRIDYLYFHALIIRMFGQPTLFRGDLPIMGTMPTRRALLIANLHSRRCSASAGEAYAALAEAGIEIIAPELASREML